LIVNIGSNRLARAMNENTVIKIKPDLIIIGGDVAYDNNVAE